MWLSNTVTSIHVQGVSSDGNCSPAEVYSHHLVTLLYALPTAAVSVVSARSNPLFNCIPAEILKHLHSHSLVLLQNTQKRDHGRLCPTCGKATIKSRSHSSKLIVAQGPPPPKVPEGWKAQWNGMDSSFVKHVFSVTTDLAPRPVQRMVLRQPSHQAVSVGQTYRACVRFCRWPTTRTTSSYI